MADETFVYAFGKGQLTPYKIPCEEIRRIASKDNSLKPGTLRYKFLDFIRIGIGLPSLDNLED